MNHFVWPQGFLSRPLHYQGIKPRTLLSQDGYARKLGARFLISAATILLSVSITDADLFEEVAGLEVDRHIWMKALPTGTERDTLDQSIEQSIHYRNLLRHSGSSMGLRHDDLTTVSEWRMQPHTSTEFSASIAYGTWRRHFAGTPDDIAIDHAETSWALRSRLDLIVFPTLKPSLAIGVGSDERSEVAIGLGGSFRNLTWTLEAGSRHATLPLTLDLPQYKPFATSFLLSQSHQSGGLEWKQGRWDFAWITTRQQSHYPDPNQESYSFMDSGRTIEHRAEAAVSSQNNGRRLRLAGSGGYLAGRHAFRGIHVSDVQRQFSFEETRHEIGWGRVDLRASRGLVEGGVFAGASRIGGEGYRPEIPDGRHFWDRSGAIDSYEGTLLNLFEQETWLFDGRMEFMQASAGGWLGRPLWKWDTQLGLTWHILDLNASGHLTQRTTVLLISFSETDHFPDFDGFRAHILTPEVGTSRKFGRFFISVNAAQAIPVHWKMAGKDQSSSPSLGRTGSSWSGGSEGQIKIGLTLK